MEERSARFQTTTWMLLVLCDDDAERRRAYPRRSESRTHNTPQGSALLIATSRSRRACSVAGALAACALAPRRMRLFEARPYRRPDEAELSAGVGV